MNNKLYVRFKGETTINVFFVALGNKLSDVIQDIEKETYKEIDLASYDKNKLN